METITQHKSSLSLKAAQAVSKTHQNSLSKSESPLAKETLADSFTPGSESGLTDLNEIIKRNKKLRGLSKGESPMLFGGPQRETKSEKKKSPVRRAFDWYVDNVDVPGPYGSPNSNEWTKPGEAHKVGKWNDQVDFVSKNGTTAEKFVHRGALVTGTAAATTAVAVGAAEVLLLNNQSITVHGALAPGAEPSLAVNGRPFFRVNATGDWWRAASRARYRANPTPANKLNLRPHYHRRAISGQPGPGQGIGQHRPWQGGW